MILYIYGPRGCGKTSNTERFKKHYNAPVYEEAHYFDDTTKMLSPAVILGEGDKMLEKAICDAMNIRCISFDEAMKESAS